MWRILYFKLALNNLFCIGLNDEILVFKFIISTSTSCRLRCRTVQKKKKLWCFQHILLFSLMSANKTTLAASLHIILCQWYQWEILSEARCTEGPKMYKYFLQQPYSDVSDWRDGGGVGLRVQYENQVIQAGQSYQNWRLVQKTCEPFCCFYELRLRMWFPLMLPNTPTDLSHSLHARGLEGHFFDFHSTWGQTRKHFTLHLSLFFIRNVKISSIFQFFFFFTVLTQQLQLKMLTICLFSFM